MADYTMQDKIEELQKRKSEALQAGPERAIERQHEKGKLLARERIDYLLDEGSFHELDMLARHRAHEAGLETRPYTDGVVTCLLYTSPSPRDLSTSRMPSSA